MRLIPMSMVTGFWNGRSARVRPQRVFGGSGRRGRQQQAVADLSLRALSETDLDALLQAVVETAADGLAADLASVLELRSDARTLLVRAAVGWAQSPVGETSDLQASSPAARALRASGPVLVEHGRGEAGLPSDTGHGIHGVASSAAMVIHGGEQPFGVLAAHSRRTRAFNPDDLSFLRLLANVLAAAVARRRSEEDSLRLAAIVESSRDAISGRTLDGIVTSWNAAAEHLFGYSAQEMLGSSVRILAPPELSGQLDGINKQLGGGEVVEQFETVRVRKDGTRIDVESTISPVTDASGKVVGASAISRDVSERKQLEEQLRQAQRLESIGQLAGGIAHDFNNLLTVVSGYTDALLEEEELSSRQELRQIAAAADRATILTRQLLAFSRRQVLQPRIIDLNEIVASITPMLSRLIGEDIELVASSHPALEPVLADPNQIEQVLVNLTVNARDAMPGGGKLTIETANVLLDEDYVELHRDASVGLHAMLAVTDNGIGMDADTIEHVFEPFFTTKPTGVGTGLGLATVYGIVKQSGGNIWVYSEPGKGTTLKVYFPVALDAVTPQPQAEPAEIAQLTGTETILVAEDDAALRGLVVSMLERRGYSVLVAASPKEAVHLAEVQERPIDLLLTDLVMPDMSGRELAEQITERIPTAGILFMSGYTDEAVIRNGALEAGAAFLEKPFTANELAQKVRDMLDHKPCRIPHN